MISDGAIKQKFIIDELKDAAESAYRFQLDSFNKRLKSKTGDTLRALSSPDYTISAGGGEFLVVANFTPQLRFQDLGVRSLYTRPLWGALKHTYGRVQYGFTEEIRKKITSEFQNAFNNQSNG